ncbi:MAG: hypothetical protein ACOCSM_01290 [Bacillota bacterium]
MKRFVVATIGTLFLLATLVVLTKPSEKPPTFTMHGIMKNHAVLHTHEDESFTFEIIMNDASSYYSYEEAMVSHFLSSEEDDLKTLLHLKSLKRQPMEEGRLKVTLTYTLPYESESGHVTLDPATLNILYDDHTHARIPLGTFTYAFPEAESSKDTLDYARVTVLSVDGREGATAGGVCLDLVNKGEETLVIHTIDPLNSALEGNMDHLHHYEGTPTPFTAFETLFGPAFNPKSESVAMKEAPLQEHEEATLCVPFIRKNSLKSDTLPFSVRYEESGDTFRTMVIDEFTYIREQGEAGHDLKEEALATLETDPKD